MADASSPDPIIDEQDFERTVRPDSFNEFVGQEKVRRNLNIYIKAARQRGEPLEHVLLSLNEENWCWRHLVNNLFRLVVQPPINGC